MGKLDVFVTRIKYALESLDDQDQEKVVNHVETYAAQVNTDILEFKNQTQEGRQNAK